MRGHKLMTREIAGRIPPLGTTDGEGERAIAHVKFFSPYTGWTWFVTEFDGVDTCYGLVFGFEREWGYFSLTELDETKVGIGVPAVERDLYWEPRPISECG